MPAGCVGHIIRQPDDWDIKRIPDAFKGYCLLRTRVARPRQPHCSGSWRVGRVISCWSCGAAWRIEPDSGASLLLPHSLVPPAHTAPRACNCYGSICMRRRPRMRSRHLGQSRTRGRVWSTRRQARQETSLQRIGSTFEWTLSLTLQIAIGIFIARSIWLPPVAMCKWKFQFTHRKTSRYGRCLGTRD